MSSSSAAALQVYREGGGAAKAVAKPYAPSLAERVACVKLDALPYIDGEYNDPATKARVDALVREEMGRFAPGDYLRDLKLREYRRPAEDAATSELLEEEMRRMARGERMEPLTATVAPPPKSLEGDVGAWQSALLNAKAQLAHQDNRTLNLELLSKYGASVWQDTLKHSEALNQTVKKQLEAKEKEIHALNAKRKIEQTAVKAPLEASQYEWWKLTVKNRQIETASGMFEAEVKKQRKVGPP